MSVCWLSWAQTGFSATEAGSIIRNQAEATYFDPASDRSFSVTSTIATVRVKSAPDFMFFNDNEIIASPAELIAFPHTITNTGNEVDRYNLSLLADQSPNVLLDRAIHIDENENGTLDPGEPPIDVTQSLQPGQSVSLLLCGRIPTLAVPGQEYPSEIQAVSVAEPSNVQTRTDIARIAISTPFKIAKSSFPPCATPINPGGTIDYKIDMVNLGELKPYAKNYNINGTVQSGFMIEDIIPANTTLVENSASRTAPDNSVIVVRRPGGSSDQFEPYSDYRNDDLIISIGLFIPVSEMRQDQAGRFAFQVRINEDMTPGTVVNNAILVDLDDDGQSDVSSNQTCNSIAAGGRGLSAQLRFLEPSSIVRQQITKAYARQQSDGVQSTSGPILPEPRHPIDVDYTDAPLYRLDNFPNYILARDGVYLEARSNALNSQGFATEQTYENAFIRVKVQSSKTSDTLNIRLLETGPNTGLFRAEVPFRLSDIESGQGRDCGPATLDQCVLRSRAGDKLQATIFDPGVQVTLEDFAVVDPLGIVFDSTSLEPLAGATVYLKTAGNTPAINPDTGTAFDPQITSEDGEYYIPRLYDGEYHISVTPPQDYTFPSIVDPDVFAGRRMVDDRSYGRQGFTGVQKSGLFLSSFASTPPVLDVPLDPNLKLGQLSLEKSADRRDVAFGDTLTYTLKIRNGTDAALLDIKIFDQPPAGFRYIDGTATLDGAPVTVDRGPNPRGLIFPIARLDVGQGATVNYQLQVAPDARPGKAVNVAIATGRTGGFVEAESPTVRETVEVSDEGLLSDRAYIIGAVWGDANANGKKDEDEIGLPGVRIWFEDGSWADTDDQGLYSLYGLKPGLKVARMDKTTLPNMTQAADYSSRQVGDGYSRFVDLSAGEMHRADFPLACMKTCGAESEFAKIAEARAALQSPDAVLDQALAYEGLIGETVSRDATNLREQVGRDGDISTGRLGTATALTTAVLTDARPEEIAQTSAEATNTELDPEKIAAELGALNVAKGEWVWPARDRNNETILSRDGRFIAVIRAGMRPTLFVDDVEVDDSRMGALVENRTENAAVAAWYGVDMEPGQHTVEVRAEDMFGNVRVLASLDVLRPGAATTLNINASEEKLFADGQSLAVITLSALDDNMAPATGTQFVTVSAEQDGDVQPLSFATADVQPNEPGFQVRMRNGTAKVELRAPGKAGIVRLFASNGSAMEAKQNVVFHAPLRDMIAVGLVEVGGDVYDLDGALSPAHDSDYPRAMEVDGRASVFLKGRIKGDALLTLSYDSEKKRTDGLFRDVDPEAYYPIYGDASDKGYEGQSRSKLYVRLEKNDSSIMWGDYRTDAFGEDSLTRMRRTLTGANAVVKSGNVTVQGFAAEARNETRTERLRGRGTALDFVLPGAPLVPNSEILTIETRDKNNPGLIASERSLVRFVDYLLDDQTGRLTLKEPIASIDEFGNPVFLVATYDVETNAKSGIVAGARGELAIKEGRVWAGVNYDESEQGVDHKLSASIGIEKDLKTGRVWAEAGRMETNLSGGGKTEGNAARFGIEANVLDGQVAAEYGQADTAFDNTDSPVLPGRREALAKYTKSLSSTIDLSATTTYSEDLATDNKRVTGEVLAQARFKKWTIAAGPRYTVDDNAAQDTEFASVLVRVERPVVMFNRPANLNLEIERAIDENRTRVQVGGDILIRDDTRFYANHRILDELPEQTFSQGLLQTQNDLGQSKTVVGLETKFLKSADVYGEWRQGGVLDSRASEAAYGVRAQWDIVEGLSIAPQLEFVNTFTPSADPNVPALDSKAISLLVADSRKANARRTVRIEGRKTDLSTYIGLRTAWAQRFSSEFTGAVKLDVAHDDLVNAPNNDRLRFTMGLARRPAESGKTDWITLYQHLNEKQALLDRTVDIISGHANREVGDKWTVSGRLVSKWEKAYGLSSSAQIIGGKVIREIGDDWDVELRASQKMINWGDASQMSLGAAVSWVPVDNLRLTVGGNIIGYDDEDLDPQGYDAKGIYWRIAVAIDESWFEWLTPNQ